MEFNKYCLYSMSAQNEAKIAKEFSEIEGIIKTIQKCKTIKDIKTFLKTTLNITDCVSNFKLGTVGFLTTSDSNKSFKVVVSYSDEKIIQIFPKK